MPTALSTIATLASVHDQLASLGYKTVEGLREAARLAPTQLDDFLGQPIGPLLAALPMPAGAPAPPPRFPTGVMLDAIPPPSVAFRHLAAVGAPPPAAADNRAYVGPIRNQTPRSTCVAFASCAVVEAAIAKTAAPGPVLSPQFLYWECKEHDGEPTEPGTIVQVAFEELEAAGVCADAVWPYDATPAAGSEEADGPPPATAAADAMTHRIVKSLAIAPTSVLDVQTQLSNGFCVAITIPVFESWYGSVEVMRTGAIVLPLPGEQPLSGHAVCLVGYRTDASRPGGGEFVLRNSWGPTWGESSADGPGYGTLPFAFLAAYGREAYSVAA